MNEVLTKIWFYKIIIGGIVTALLATVFTWGYESYKTRKSQESSAAILYYDMKDFLDIISISENPDMKKITGMKVNILKNELSLIDKNNILDYLVSIRGQVKEKDFENIKAYYSNVRLLESTRKRYWDSSNQEVINSLENEYADLIKQLKSLYEKDEQGFNNTIEKLREIAKIKLQ